MLVAAGGLQLAPAPVEIEKVPVPTTSKPLAQALRPEVAAIIRRACKDCHSNETTWPWYSHVAPVSWMIARDVQRGRNKLNFSEWGARRPSANQVAEVCDAVANGSMPLRPYLLMHAEARLTREDVDVICDWADRAMAEARRPAIGSDDFRRRQPRS